MNRDIVAMAALGVLTCAGVFAWRETSVAADDVRRAVNLLVIEARTEKTMAVYKTTWKSANNVTQEVVTTRIKGTGGDPDETAAEHAARHKADVDALTALFPPV